MDLICYIKDIANKPEFLIIIYMSYIQEAEELSQKYLKELTTEEIYEKALQLARNLRYETAVETIKREAQFWSKEAIKEDLIEFLQKGEKISEYNLIMMLTD